MNEVNIDEIIDCGNLTQHIEINKELIETLSDKEIKDKIYKIYKKFLNREDNFGDMKGLD